MTVIEQIKAKIDKLYGEYKDKFHQCGDQYHLGLIDGLDMAEQVLDTLESEKPMQEGLEEELERFIASGKSVTVDDYGTYKVSYHDFKKVARHFAEWGYLRAAEKYNEIEYNRQRAEEEMPLPEDTVLFNKGVAEGRRLAEEELSDLLTVAHLQGADQMKEQMMEEAVEGEVIAVVIHDNGDEIHYSVTYPFGERPHSMSDKVKMLFL